MTVSKIYIQTAGDIIQDALRDAKIIPAEQPVEAVDYQNGLDSLNSISKYWQTKGIHLWLLERAVLPLNVGQKVYALGPTGDPCGYQDGFYPTTLNADQIAADTTLTVTSTAGMFGAADILDSDPTDSTQDWTAGNDATLSVSSGLRITNGAANDGYATYDLAATIGQTYRVRVSYTLGTSAGVILSVLNGGVVADTLTLTASDDVELVITASTQTITFQAQNTSSTGTEYSTVYDLQYVDDKTGSRIGIELNTGLVQWTYVLEVDSTTQIEITEGLSSAASSGNQIFSFAQQIDRPLKLFNATFTNAPGNSEVPVNRWSRQEYTQQPDKTSQGTVVNWYYNPTLGNGLLFVWQTASSIQNTFQFDVRKPLSVYSETTDILDVPDEYLMPLKWAIAADLGPSYGVSDTRQGVLEGKAAQTLEEALDNDNEADSIFIAPDYMGG